MNKVICSNCKKTYTENEIAKMSQESYICLDCWQILREVWRSRKLSNENELTYLELEKFKQVANIDHELFHKKYCK